MPAVFQLPANILGKAVEGAQVLGSLAPMRETQMELLAPGFGLSGPARGIVATGGKNQQLEDLFLSALCLSKKKISFFFLSLHLTLPFPSFASIVVLNI